MRTAKITTRELWVALITGAIMGVISYLTIRHVEEYLKKRVGQAVDNQM